MITITNKSGMQFDRIRPSKVVSIASKQIQNNEKLRRWFNDVLSARRQNIDAILSGDIEVPVYIYKHDDGLLDSPEQVRWDGVFTHQWPGQPDRSIALASGLFDPDWLESDRGDRRDAATCLIHGLAHWVEAYALNRIWPDRPKGYDTGAYVESLIDWGRPG